MAVSEKRTRLISVGKNQNDFSRDDTWPWMHIGAARVHHGCAPRLKGLLRQGESLKGVGWLMGLEPTTTGITILDSTN